MPRPTAHLPLLLLLLALVSPIANAQVPDLSWGLEQNTPNPFCPLTGSTSVPFVMPRATHVLLRVWDPDSTTVVRTLADGYFMAGPNQITWDGTDDSNALLPDGAYPITMTTGSDSVEFAASIRATIDMSLCTPPVPTWRLEQNTPNPFCPSQGPTSVRFEMPRMAHVLLRVWSPESMMVVRTLVDEVHVAGRHMVAWDGRDDSGVALAGGEYPLTMTAETDSVEFMASIRATIDCANAAVDGPGMRDAGPRVFLSAPTPNPLASGSGATHLSLLLREPDAVGVAVYDASGRITRRLLKASTSLAAGRHEVIWDGRTDSGSSASGGIYWVRVSATSGSACRTVILLR